MPDSPTKSGMKVHIARITTSCTPVRVPVKALSLKSEMTRHLMHHLALLSAHRRQRILLCGRCHEPPHRPFHCQSPLWVLASKLDGLSRVDRLFSFESRDFSGAPHPKRCSNCGVPFAVPRQWLFSLLFPVTYRTTPPGFVPRGDVPHNRRRHKYRRCGSISCPAERWEILLLLPGATSRTNLPACVLQVGAQVVLAARPPASFSLDLISSR
jgi:hypothetical protein